MKSDLNIAICDDSAADLNSLHRLIESIDAKSKISVFESGEYFLSDFKCGLYDLVFLDIYMDGVSGIEVAESIRLTDERVVITFTTTSEEHALESYRLNALKYIVKPIKPKDVQNALELALLLREKREACTVIAGETQVKIPLDEIYYIEVINHTCVIHTPSDIVKVNMTMDSMEKILPPPRFLRCHRSFIVNLEHVRSVDEDFTIVNGDKVYIRKADLKNMKQHYESYMYSLARGREGERPNISDNVNTL